MLRTGSLNKNTHTYCPRVKYNAYLYFSALLRVCKLNSDSSHEKNLGFEKCNRFKEIEFFEPFETNELASQLRDNEEFKPSSSQGKDTRRDAKNRIKGD